MKKKSTHFSIPDKHPDVTISASDDASDVTMENVIAGLERQVASGVRFKIGQTMQMGCSLLKFAACQDGENLELHEPDYCSLPIVFRDEISTTVRHLYRQSVIAESLPEKFFQRSDPCSIIQSAVACTLVKETANGLLLRRSMPTGSDSGWFVGCINDHDHGSANNLYRDSIYAIMLSQPAISDFLFLPAGCMVHFVPERYLAIYDELGVVADVRKSTALCELFPFLR